MKKYIIYNLILVSYVLAGCNEFIDIPPVSNVSVSNFYKTPKDMEQAVVSAYDALQQDGQYGQNFCYFMEVRSDNSKQSSTTNSGGIYGDFELFRIDPTNAVLTQTWKQCYVGIQRCNILLNRIDGVKMDAVVSDNLKGEAKFIRALTYFNLVRIWGRVPLVITETQDPFDFFALGQSESSVIYEQIIKDLTEAVEQLPSSQVKVGRAPKGAAQTLLGKVYLTQKKYPEAIAQLKSVIGKYSLVASYANIFGQKNENNVESIFEIQYTAGGIGEGSRYANLFAPMGGNQLIGNIGQVFGDNIPTTTLEASYENGDLRKDATIGKLANGNLYCKKYIETPFANLDGNCNFIVLRYADVLLMLAEALNEQSYIADGESFAYLNAVRKRAGLPELKSSQLTNQELFRNAVASERQHELAFENHRWFDLVRTGKAIEVMNSSTDYSDAKKITINVEQLVFPIPQNEIDTNPEKISQNVGSR